MRDDDRYHLQPWHVRAWRWRHYAPALLWTVRAWLWARRRDDGGTRYTWRWLWRYERGHVEVHKMRKYVTMSELKARLGDDVVAGHRGETGDSTGSEDRCR